MDSKSKYRLQSSKRAVQLGLFREFLFVDSDWAADHLANDNVRIVEVDYAPKTDYEEGHIPGAHLLSWKEDLSSNSQTEILDRSAFESIMSKMGATRDTTIVLYGDVDNVLAIFAFWIFQSYGHENIKILDGGRKSWTDSGRMLTMLPSLPRRRSEYVIKTENAEIRPNFMKATERLESYQFQRNYRASEEWTCAE